MFFSLLSLSLSLEVTYRSISDYQSLRSGFLSFATPVILVLYYKLTSILPEALNPIFVPSRPL